MQHTELASSIFITFYQYAKHVEMVSRGARVVTLQLYSDGSGNVIDLADNLLFFSFNDLKELLVKLEEQRREQAKDY